MMSSRRRRHHTLQRQRRLFSAVVLAGVASLAAPRAPQPLRHPVLRVRWGADRDLRPPIDRAGTANSSPRATFVAVARVRRGGANLDDDASLDDDDDDETEAEADDETAVEDDDDDEDDGEDDDIDAATAERASTWILEQVKRRQERIVLLSQSLAERGMPFSSLESLSASLVEGASAARTPGSSFSGPLRAPEWVCALATDDAPRSCLIWGDAEPDAKVIRPRRAGQDQWVSLAALNTLRRTDPVKASRLWFDQYLLDMRRFSRDAGPLGLLVGLLLDSPHMIRLAAAAACAFVLVLARPVLQFLLVCFLTSSLCWRHYGSWSPVVHAPLPLKLLILRQAYLYAAHGLALVEKAIFDKLADYESDLFEATAKLSPDPDAGPDQPGTAAGSGGAASSHDDDGDRSDADDASEPTMPIGLPALIAAARKSVEKSLL